MRRIRSRDDSDFTRLGPSSLFSWQFRHKFVAIYHAHDCAELSLQCLGFPPVNLPNFQILSKYSPNRKKVLYEISFLSPALRSTFVPNRSRKMKKSITCCFKTRYPDPPAWNLHHRPKPSIRMIEALKDKFTFQHGPISRMLIRFPEDPRMLPTAFMGKRRLVQEGF